MKEVSRSQMAPAARFFMSNKNFFMMPEKYQLVNPLAEAFIKNV